ncbi:hypothetical protein pEaSNUABM56_00173 [Erwinia phage pEa_SNUABM_56]|uniref:Uncharacterized protein n=1 Tax=Erwinia phage pEp_SNUABM_01 TaxID=2601643 RepID=A0A5J6DAN8_9CAUD|nr:hypothetical protein HWC63_gp229 [Erwinia phage pEp_SNUABM_01]QEQ94949.1 hypothetical protein pEpSNUABM01_123 [Erwinia phage pEp_SNUABM_01]UYL84875.1 hypothetical protein pEaSNUABM55_00102 [Erwinia phage pEa_SNUABM_55]UYL85193.1 hypothetical protein pEaSNUABM56_00173 [Erwinia phage pEa_SNUABM_56]
MALYSLFSLLCLAFVFCIWSKDGLLNLAIKMIFLGMTIWGAIVFANIYHLVG